MENLVNGGNSAVTSCLVTLQEVHDWFLGVGIPPLGGGTGYEEPTRHFRPWGRG